ncbi:RraA family protein [Acuticoccus sp.]|uniref:RraA family protein n=1 Tax=Acuticoccus sp. TaxID=1904378 RepID=UPI003B523BD4
MRASASAIAALVRYDTPTVCNGLEEIGAGHRDAGYTRRTMVMAPDGLRLADGARAVCGRAKTVRIRASRPHGRSASDAAALKAAYYAYVADADGPTVIVVEDLDAEPVGAFWGEVHSALHRALGAVGVITNGIIRDLDDLDPALMLLAGGVGPSHAHVHWVDYGEGASVFGMSVAEGDLVHADRHGAVVVPDDAVGALPDAIEAVRQREARILALTARSPFDHGALRRVVLGDTAEPGEGA